MRDVGSQIRQLLRRQFVKAFSISARLMKENNGGAVRRTRQVEDAVDTVGTDLVTADGGVFVFL